MVENRFKVHRSVPGMQGTFGGPPATSALVTELSSQSKRTAPATDTGATATATGKEPPEKRRGPESLSTLRSSQFTAPRTGRSDTIDQVFLLRPSQKLLCFLSTFLY